MHLGQTLMLYLQYRLHNSWEEPYKRAPRRIKYPNFDQKMTQNVDIILNSYQFGQLDKT